MNQVEFQKKQAFFNDCLEDLDRNKEVLTPTEFRYAGETIRAVRVLWQEQNFFSGVSNETKRNQEITDRTKLIAEPGLVPGQSSDEIKRSISLRVEDLAGVYQFDVEEKTTFLFFKEAFIGPPCFNGRLNTLQRYIMSRRGVKPKQFFEYQTPYDAEAAKLGEVMYVYEDEYGLDKQKPPTQEQLRTFLEEHPEIAGQYSIDLEVNHFGAIYQRACIFYVE